MQVALWEGYLNVVGIECVVDGLFYAPCHDKFLFDEHPVGYEQVDTVVAKLVKYHADGLLGTDDVAAVGLLALQLFYCVNEHCAHLVHVYAISHANGYFHHFVRVVFGDVLKVLAKERTVEKRYYAAVGGDNLCALVGDAVHLAAYAVTFYKVAHAHTSGHE